MRLSHVSKELMKKAIPNSIKLQGFTPAAFINKIETTNITAPDTIDTRGRWETQLWFDYTSWFGTGSTMIEANLAKNAVTIMDMVDFYNYERCTSYGPKPFELIFLNVHHRKYNLSKSDLVELENSIKCYNGALSWAMLIDTMNMIMTGTRDIPLPMLISYMDSGIIDIKVVVEERFDREELAALSSAQFLHRWISTERGMRDCIEMHRLVYNIKW